jgi:hypothetical protein
MPTELTHIIELFQLPFMQRALLGGILTGLMGGMLGSFTILRQLSFFSLEFGLKVKQRDTQSELSQRINPQRRTTETC